MNAYGNRDGSPPQMLGIGGSTRRNSKSRLLLAVALRIAEEAGALVTLADVRDLDLPIYDHDRPLEAYPSSLSNLLTAVREADAFVLCSPTYHGTVSGAVKNVLDTLSVLGEDDPPYFAGKPVALMAFGSAGAANVLTSLQHSRRALNGLSITAVVAAGGNAIAVANDMVRRLRGMNDELLDLAMRLRTGAPILAGTS